MVTSVTFAIARRQWLDAQSRIAGNSFATRAGCCAGERTRRDFIENTPPPMTTAKPPVNHLAEADPVRLPEASAPGILPSKPAIHGRLGYDLDHGTLVAPDTRESKPIY